MFLKKSFYLTISEVNSLYIERDFDCTQLSVGVGGLPYERCGDARRLAYGCKFRVLVSLGVFIAKQDERLIFFQFVLFTRFM